MIHHQCRVIATGHSRDADIAPLPLAPRHPVADGSLTLYLGVQSPGKGKEANWLPAPKGRFSLLLRNYWPDQAIIDGTSVPPDAVRVK